MNTTYKKGSNGYALYGKSDDCNPKYKESASVTNIDLDGDGYHEFDEGFYVKVGKTHTANNKYDRVIVGKCGKKVVVDVYRVLDAWGVVNPQLQHSVKKGLQTGGRGHKTYIEDLIDIRDSIDNAIKMHEQVEGI